MQQIADWLQKLGLGQYAQPFAENDINFAVLPDLTDQDLKELGVASLGHRRQLLRAIAEISGPQKQPALPPSAAEATVAPHETAERRHTDLFKVLIGQIRQDDKANVVLGKTLRVLSEAELPKPVRDLLHRGRPRHLG